MRSKIKKGIALVLSAVLTVATCITTIPQLSETVFAAETGKNIQLGAAALSDNVNTSSAATVHYDSNSDTWRVIGYDGNGVASSSGTLTLIASGNMEHGVFCSSFPHSNNYSGSNLQSMIETLADRLSTEEKAAVDKRTLEGGSSNHGDDGYDDNKISGSEVSDSVMWPLSVEEATAMNSDLRKADPEHSSWRNSYWWLRSPGNGPEDAAYVPSNDNVYYDGCVYSENEYGVRPAFNLNLSPIIFTSDAAGIKSSGAAGTLSAPGSHSTTNWKLTVASGSLTASSGTITRSGSTITVPFTVSGDHNRISVFISDREWNANGAELKYYGALNTSGSSGTFTLPGDYNSSWKVYILAEKINGDTKTDYASTPAEITIPDASGGGGPAPSPTPTATPTPTMAPSPTPTVKPIDPTKGFRDVPAGKWYSDPNGPIAYVVANGIMKGTGDGSNFEPESPCTREMFVQILYNAEGASGAGPSTPFEDVRAGKWYYNAVTWALANNVTGGKSANQFGIGENVTREQIAQFLMNYAKKRGYDVSARADVSKFPDAGEISGWAKEAVSWANANGIINGKAKNGKNYLAPKVNGSRAEIAQMIMNFQNKFGR